MRQNSKSDIGKNARTSDAETAGSNVAAERKYLTIVEAAERARMGVSTLRTLIAKRVIEQHEGVLRPKGTDRIVIYWPDFRDHFLHFKARGER